MTYLDGKAHCWRCGGPVTSRVVSADEYQISWEYVLSCGHDTVEIDELTFRKWPVSPDGSLSYLRCRKP